MLLEVVGELIPPLALLAGLLGAFADRLADVRPGLFDGPVGARLDTALAPDGELSLGGERHRRLRAVLGEPVVGVAVLVAELLLAAAGVGELAAGTRSALLLDARFGEQLAAAAALAPAELLGLLLERARTVARGALPPGGVVGGLLQPACFVGGGAVQRRERRRGPVAVLRKLEIGALLRDPGVPLDVLLQRFGPDRAERAAEPLDRIGHIHEPRTVGLHACGRRRRVAHRVVRGAGAQPGERRLACRLLGA